MHAILSYRGNRPTNTKKYTHKQTNPQTGPITMHCAAKLSAQCNNKVEHVIKKFNRFSERAEPHQAGCLETTRDQNVR